MWKNVHLVLDTAGYAFAEAVPVSAAPVGYAVAAPVASVGYAGIRTHNLHLFAASFSVVNTNKDD